MWMSHDDQIILLFVWFLKKIHLIDFNISPNFTMLKCQNLILVSAGKRGNVDSPNRQYTDSNQALLTDKTCASGSSARGCMFSFIDSRECLVTGKSGISCVSFTQTLGWLPYPPCSCYNLFPRLVEVEWLSGTGSPIFKTLSCYIISLSAV